MVKRLLADPRARAALSAPVSSVHMLSFELNASPFLAFERLA